MKAIRLKGSGGLERLTKVEMDVPGALQEGQILVRLHASSLNYHDYLVALAKIPTAEPVSFHCHGSPERDRKTAGGAAKA